MIKINKKLILFLALVISFSLLFADDSDTTALRDTANSFKDRAITPAYNDVKELMMQEGACDVSEGYMLPMIIPSVLVGFAMILISVIIYMGGQFLQSPQVIGIAKEEFYQSGISIFLAFLVISLGVSSSGVLAIFGYEGDTFLDRAISVSYEVTDQIATDLSVMMVFNGIVGYLASSTLSIGSFHAQISFSPGLALKPITDVITLIVQFLSVSLSEWLFHIFSLCLIKKWALSVFVPIGMLMRAIPHTREGGSAIIALMLVLYLIYPITFLGTGSIYRAVHKTLDLQGLAINFIGEFGLGITMVALVFALIAQSVLVPIIIFGGIDTVMIFMKEAIFMFFIMSLILPFFNIVIALTAAKELAKNFFGVDVNLSAIIRVI